MNKITLEELGRPPMNWDDLRWAKDELWLTEGHNDEWQKDSKTEIWKDTKKDSVGESQWTKMNWNELKWTRQTKAERHNDRTTGRQKGKNMKIQEKGLKGLPGKFRLTKKNWDEQKMNWEEIRQKDKITERQKYRSTKILNDNK